jgi:hypothetical protein
MQKEHNISIYIHLASLNIHIDQFTLKFFIQFFKIRFNNFFLEKEDEATPSNTNNMDNTMLSHIGDRKLTERSEIVSLKMNYLIKRIIIQEFSININYNSQKLPIDNLKEKDILQLVDFSNINDLKLVFKNNDIRGPKKPSQIFQELYSNWKEDILKSQIVKAYLGSISIIRPFKNVVGGFIELFKQPYESYKHDTSFEEGLVNGVKKFVVTFTTESLMLGEKVYINLYRYSVYLII